MALNKFARRRFVTGTAGASAGLIAAPFVRSAHAAGKLSVGLWDHWVPNANNASHTRMEEWAEKGKVEVAIDFITTRRNNSSRPTPFRKRRSIRHDILALTSWLPS